MKKLADKFRLLASKPRIDHRIAGKKFLRWFVVSVVGRKELANLGSLERPHHNSRRHEIGKLAASVEMHFGVLHQHLKRRQETNEITKRAGKEHADSALN